MIGAVIPAHNEEQHVERCLQSVLRAARHPALLGEPVEVVIVLDSCTDGTADIVRRLPVTALEVWACNVGLTRATGAAHLIQLGARWLASTDADSEVAPDWFAAQLAYGADAVCGVVEVDDWTPHSPGLRARYEAAYHDHEGHQHIHGANFGISTAAYLQAGGFPSMTVDEDVTLVTALQTQGARIAWSNSVRVRTSSRLDCRARGGFGDYLSLLGATA